jgi:hypothetical protein
MSIVETSIEEFPLPDEALIVLLMDRAAMINDLQARY